MTDFLAWLPFLARAAVLGFIGGVGLVLTQVYSRRGPLIYPVYAAILAALALLGARFPELPYTAHFSAVLIGMLVATNVALVAVLVRGARERRALIASGRPLHPGGAPWWGFPAIAAAIVASSAAVAFISS
jgi:hypothetical protein